MEDKKCKCDYCDYHEKKWQENQKIKDKKQEHLHYLGILKKCSAVMQFEIREAIDFAIELAEKNLEQFKKDKGLDVKNE